MTLAELNALYSQVYAAYDYAALKDEYSRSTLGDVLDHLILLKQHTFTRPSNP